MIWRISGATLIELLITMALAIFLLSGFLQFYLGLTKTIQYQSAFDELQETARVAMRLFENDIQSLGTVGCGRLGELRISGHQHLFPISKSGAIQVSKNKHQSLTLSFFESLHAVLKAPLFSGTQSIMLKKPVKDLKAGDWLIVSSCWQFESVRVLSYQGQRVLLAEPLVLNFKKGALLGRWREVEWLVKKTKRKNRSNDPVWALFQKEKNRPSVERVQGVRSFQVVPSKNNLKIILETQSESRVFSHGKKQRLRKMWTHVFE